MDANSLWSRFEHRANYDGVKEAVSEFRDNNVPDPILLEFATRYLGGEPLSKIALENLGFSPTVDTPTDQSVSESILEPSNEGPRIQAAPKSPETTWTATRAQESWVDELLEKEFPEPKKKRKVKYDQRVVDKEIAKNLIVHFLNADKDRRRKGYKITTLYEEVEWVKTIDERTLRRYLDELYKEGQVKMWRKPYILPSGKKVYHQWYTSATNPDPNFTLWVTK